MPNVCPVPQPGPESPKRCDEVWGKPHRTLILGMGKPRHRALKRPAPAQEQLGCRASAVPTGTQNLPRLCRRARHGWVALSKLEVTLGPLGFAGLCDVSPQALPLLPSARLLCRRENSGPLFPRILNSERRADSVQRPASSVQHWPAGWRDLEAWCPQASCGHRRRPFIKIPRHPGGAQSGSSRRTEQASGKVPFSGDRVWSEKQNDTIESEFASA